MRFCKTKLFITMAKVLLDPSAINFLLIQVL